MQIKPMSKLTLKFPKRIASYFPRYEITLLTGLPGTGKSYSLLKQLNESGISPILFNLDSDATLLKFQLTGATNSEKDLKNFINNKFTDLHNEVIVIDTYQRAKEILKINTEAEQEKFTNELEKIAHTRKTTIIIVGHPVDFVGSSSIFKDNPSLVRNCYEHLHIDKIIDKRKNTDNIKYLFFVNKGRGIGGTQVIENWMR